ncbi:ThuA domain-containing protein [Flavobacterium sp. CF136]|uniref:ThuA domain-containing protein n=1 Tax=Flavobacterium sp. (strain CF136) TaxID=1144313 RepID=UPI0002718E7B|nr:ThuA domain-containing protein [Flavobacterium sp. CF136]EJL60412.1 hypothetical protein PMI10_03837 [Flavobacterium sp. CF136]
MTRNIYILVTAVFLATALFLSCSIKKQFNTTAKKILVFTKTAGFHHSSIPQGIEAVKLICSQNGLKVKVTDNSDDFTKDSLAVYSAVLFLNTTGDVLNSSQQEAFEHYIKSGGGFAGIHSAADTEPDWPWYIRLVGAKFAGHPNNPNVLKAVIDITGTRFPATQGLPLRWERTDEWYNYSDISADIKVIATLDESTYSGGTNGKNHPIAWYHSFEGGRAFYTGGGHTEASYAEPLFLKHLTEGIKYAAGIGAAASSK